jgi:hypothetical protein
VTFSDLKLDKKADVILIDSTAEIEERPPRTLHTGSNYFFNFSFAALKKRRTSGESTHSATKLLSLAEENDLVSNERAIKACV